MEDIKESVKVYVGYEYPRKDDSYAKDKAIIGVSYTKSCDKLKREKVEKELFKVVDRLADKLGKHMLVRAEEVIKSLVEKEAKKAKGEYEKGLKEFETRLKKAKVEYLKIKEQLDKLS